MEQSKPWYLSKTIWGSLIAVIAALLSGVGLDIDERSQAVLVDTILQGIAVVGSLFAIVGRLSASTLIE
ncbi:MAG: hypothetical protein AAFO77_06100 [Pseudomonadota bacterium]